MCGRVQCWQPLSRHRFASTAQLQPCCRVLQGTCNPFWWRPGNIPFRNSKHPKSGVKKSGSGGESKMSLFALLAYSLFTFGLRFCFLSLKCSAVKKKRLRSSVDDRRKTLRMSWTAHLHLRRQQVVDLDLTLHFLSSSGADLMISTISIVLNLGLVRDLGPADPHQHSQI